MEFPMQQLFPPIHPFLAFPKSILQKNPMERKPLQKPKPCTKRYSVIKIRLTDRTPDNLTEVKKGTKTLKKYISRKSLTLSLYIHA